MNVRTLMLYIFWAVFQGGPADHANNYPFRGAKGSDFEGGTRVVAFISGGFLPESARTMGPVNGMMHVADW